MGAPIKGAYVVTFLGNTHNVVALVIAESGQEDVKLAKLVRPELASHPTDLIVVDDLTEGYDRVVSIEERSK
jgi:hypothetical protein